MISHSTATPSRTTPSRAGAPVDIFSESCFALVIASSALESCLYDLIADIQKECAPDEVNVQDGIALVAAVGRKMSSRPGTSGRLFQALGQEGLNIRTIAQGADELSIIVGVDNSDFEKTIRVLYDGFTG